MTPRNRKINRNPFLSITVGEGDVNNTGSKRKVRCKQSAAEMLCLTRYLGLMIGDLIKDRNDPHWMIYRALREIICIIMAPYYTEADVCRVDDLIVKHNEDFMRYLRDLLPKDHFATHIARIMRLNGPLWHFWGMAPERKNKDCKETATGTSSKKKMFHILSG